MLFLVFNRPETTQRVFETIRAARPPRLYIAADGPRYDRPGEGQRCMEARRIATSVDWPCEVRTLFRDSNLGCRLGVSSAISWFFENEEEGIILEDDVLPQASFFRYCEELLERYRHDERVMVVGGSNLIASHYSSPDSYFFTRFNFVWGWASWRRAWQHYDIAMNDWPSWRDTGGLLRLWDGDRRAARQWGSTFESMYRCEIDTWDHQWTFALWQRSALSVVPTTNQIDNIGFGVDATHTTSGIPDFVRESPRKSMSFPLVHPREVVSDPLAEQLFQEKVFGLDLVADVKQRLRRIPWLGRWILAARTFVRGASA